MLHDLIVVVATLAVFVPTATVALVLFARRKMRAMLRSPMSIPSTQHGATPNPFGRKL